MDTIKNIRDLCEHFDADAPNSLPRRLYKDTACGASISLYLADGRELHTGERWPDEEEIERVGLQAFTLQTIVEGIDATVDSEPIPLPVSVAFVREVLAYIEHESERLWQQAHEGPSPPDV